MPPTIEIKPVSGPEDATAKPRRWTAIDTETALIEEDTPVPPVTLMTWIHVGDDGAHDGPRLETLHTLVRAFEFLLRHALATRTTICAHNLAFDVTTILREAPELFPLVFDVYDAGLFEDTLLNEKLDDIARGEYENKQKGRWASVPGDDGQPVRVFLRYSLADSMRKRFGIDLDKGEDTYRTRYGELRGVPREALPEAAQTYALDDARAHWLLRQRQEADEVASPARPGWYVYADAPAQARAGLALQLCRWQGIWTDPARTARLKATLRARQDAVLARLVELGFVRPGKFRPKAKDWQEPSRDTKRIKDAIVAACERAGVEPLRTNPSTKFPDGQVSDSEEAIARLDDPDLEKLLEFKSVQKLLSYTTILEKGHEHPIHSEPNTLVANGRISWGSDAPDGATSPKSVNLTNLPAEPGVRECYVPPPGHVFFAIDYSTLELCTVAQVCLWLGLGSRLAEYINDNVDMHSKLGSMLLGQDDEKSFAKLAKREVFANDAEADETAFYKAVRDLAKRGNFGLWGGMGIDRFLSTVRDLRKPLLARGIVLDAGLIRRLKDMWMRMLPETERYFALADRVANGSGQIVQWTSGRIRGGLGYTDTANTHFSGLAADGAKDALYRITRAMYGEPWRACFGDRLIAFIHDEFFGAVRQATAHEAAHEIRDIAQATMQMRTPDVRIKCSIALMYAWRKGASAYYDADGRLCPWEDSPGFKQLLAKGEVPA